ncbi:hypothetical protein [Gordonia iterans]
MHGIALLDPDTSRVHTTNSTRAGGSKTAQRFVHPGPLRDADVVEVDGVRVTSLVRTAVDLACAENDFAKALTIFDGALRRGATVDQLTTELKARRRVGAAIARYALAHSNADSASVGESWSRAQMIEADLPTPKLQTYYLLPEQDGGSTSTGTESSSASSTARASTWAVFAPTTRARIRWYCRRSAARTSWRRSV